MGATRPWASPCWRRPWPPRRTPSRRPRRPAAAWLAVAEAIGVNVFVNRFDAWATDQAWARVSPSSWRRNLRLGWEWDENEFGTNLFAHPYHGGLYFNAGRANGLDFWESAPLAFLGSWSWEYLGERFRPSLNDFFMTSLGGIALGESFHRVGASIRDNQARGGGRILREIAALPLDPMGGLNRLVRGGVDGHRPQPARARPLRLRPPAGGRGAGHPGHLQHRPRHRVGHPGGRPPLPRPDHPALPGPLRRLRGPGPGERPRRPAPAARLRPPLRRQPQRHHPPPPPPLRGEPALRLRPEPRPGVRRAERRGGDLLPLAPLGALRPPHPALRRCHRPRRHGRHRGRHGAPGLRLRPRAGVRTEVAFERKGVTWLRSWARSEVIHSVSGAPADHEASFGGFEAVVPLPYRFGVGLHTGYFRRVSRYPGKVREKRDFTEARLFISWAAVGSNALVGAP
ncbi:MAG: DUF3943 domain-containing protein [Gemmatimonadetes bacterium]|nr:DUF3943 domain-containing protein [Gemmatimonadota bacterium]